MQVDQTDSVSSMPAHRNAPVPRTRRDFLRLAGAGLAAAALSSCSLPPSTPTPTTGQKVQLVYQDWRTDWFPPMARELLDQFHATHPNISVFYVPDPVNLEDEMPSDMQAGVAADVFQGCCAHFPIWAQKGYTLDLSPYVRADVDQATIDDWDLAQYRSFFTRDGRQYGLPKYHGALALYYNKDILERYRVPFPDGSWSYDDYLAAMRQLTQDRDGDRKADLWGSMMDVSWDRIQIHVNGFGGRFVDPADPTRCRMGDPSAIKALEWLRARMRDDRVMATFQDVENVGTSQAFISQRVAMVEDGSWSLKSILSGARFRVGVAPFPTAPVRKVTLTSTDGFGIYAGTRHPEAAWELMKFLISKEYGRAMARANFLQPARASLVEEWVAYVRNQFPRESEGVDIAAFADGQLKGYSVTTEVFPNMADAQRIAMEAWDRILTLGQAPVEYMVAAAQQIQEAQKGESSGGRSCC